MVCHFHVPSHGLAVCANRELIKSEIPGTPVLKISGPAISPLFIVITVSGLAILASIAFHVAMVVAHAEVAPAETFNMTVTTATPGRRSEVGVACAAPALGRHCTWPTH